MRFLIRVAPETAAAGGAPPATAVVSVHCPTIDPAWAPPSRTIRLVPDGRTGTMPLPDTVPDPASPHAALWGGDTAEFQRALGHFRARRATGAEVFGRYLFEVMVGSPWWTTIRQQPNPDGLIELALAWKPGDALRAFERLPWELMHDGTRPLVASYDPRVAVTRVVESEVGVAVRQSPPQLDLPVRILFVLGARADDPRIRAATEILGLLSSLEQPDRTQPVVLESASPKKVASYVRTFKPQVVHFLCHGDVRDGRGVLELQPDEPGERGDCNGARLLDVLRPDGQAPPTMVVLGACRSAEASDFAAGTTPAPTDLATLPGQPVVLTSLATELVLGGVPVVVGMGGRVADVAARLFTRRLEASLLQGRPLVSATADARLAPFVNPANGAAKSLADVSSVDWAYPTLLMHESVDPSYAPTPAPGAGGVADVLKGWIANMKATPPNHPVFCGRQRFVDAFDDLFGRGRGVLVAYTNPKTDSARDARFGKSRLLEQLAFRALRMGHLPVAWFKQRSATPRTLHSLLGELRKAVAAAYTQLEVAPPPHRVTASLASALADPAAPKVDAAKLAVGHALTDATAQAAGGDESAARRVRALQELAAEIQDVGLGGRAAVLALRHDLFELAHAFRAQLGALRAREEAAGRLAPAWAASAATSRVVLLLDDFDVLDRDFVEAVLELASQTGLGVSDEAIPLVLMGTLDETPGSQLLRPVVENPKPSFHAIELGPFTAGEEQLVYQRTLLHPFDKTLIADPELNVSSAMPLAPSGEVTLETRVFCEKQFARQLKGRPDLLRTETLYLVAAVALDKKFLVEANDDDVLRHLEPRP